jgi:MFS transporter, PAT family, beta-lactamase induction signal transducer AmpG
VSGERTKRNHLFWTTSAYFGEGFPFSFIHQLSTEYLTSLGASRPEIGYTSWFHGAVALKPLVSPLIDAARARRRTMIFCQLVLGLAMAVSAVWIVQTLEARTYEIAAAFWGLLGVLAVIHAVHDIACDGFFIVALTPREQPLYAGTRMAAYRVALFVGSALLTLLAAHTEWRWAFLAAGGLMTATAVLNALLVPRIDEPGGTTAGKTTPVLSGFWEAYRTLFAQPQLWLVLLFVVSYRLGDVLTFAMSPPLLRELGMDTGLRAYLRMISLGASVVGSILAGTLLARGGLHRWFAPFTYVMVLPFYLLLAWLRPGFWGIALVVAIEQFAGALAGAALPLFLIQRSRRGFAAAHYAFFTALTAVASTIVGGVSGHLNEDVGNLWYFAICFFVAIPAIILVHIVPHEAVEKDAG